MIVCKYRFGPFELRLSTRELFKHDIRLKLRPQTFQVLLVLLEHPGECVTRDELRNRIWPGNEFGDFEHGLNTVIKDLRATLSDSVSAPHYIETFPKLGYRIIVPVVAMSGTLSENSSAIRQAEVSRVPAFTSEEREIVKTSSPISLLRGFFIRRKVSRALAIAATLAVISILSSAAIRNHFPTKLRFLRSSTQASPAPLVRSLAVLPFDNLSNDSNQEYFADGITDQLISELGHIGSVRVVSRTSVMQYKRIHRSLPDIARELTVEAIVEGTVVKSGNRVRVTAQLIQASTDKQLWSRSYEAELRDVLDLQNQIATGIADQVRSQLISNGRAWLPANRAIDPEAYEAYLKGLYFWNKRGPDGLQRAAEYFKLAIQKDPDYAAAYAGLADSYVLLADGADNLSQTYTIEGKSAANRALILDPSLAGAHTALGLLAEHDWHFPEAEREFKLGATLGPNDATAHHWYGEGYLLFMGRFEEANAELKQARALDPISRIIATDWGVALYNERRYSEAYEELTKVIDLDPNFAEALEFRGLVLLKQGKFNAGIADLRKTARIENSARRLAFLAYGLGIAGRKAEARQLLRNLETLSKTSHVNAWYFALVHTGLAGNDQAFAWLNKALAERSADLISLKTGPIYDSLRDDQRFAMLLTRVGVPN
jgi:TolB-like protein/DNA-binding winged helix-turn-helix (wHTH) protein/Flp pilus assembly protein TadD